ncbi:MAG TPA: DUF5996 family protein [Thermoanaerobaculia bacterium]|nr:DUF5996 family protein [Thermoanaerobaculia bacterium]
MSDDWPALPYSQWSDTCETLHMWTQVVGKIRMTKTPPVNHWWHVPLYVTSRGLGTSPIPDGARTFEIDFDFVDHRLRIDTTDGGRRDFELRPMTVAEFYSRVMRALAELRIDVTISTTPSEVSDPIPFEKDTVRAAYDADAVSRFWHVLISACRVFAQFRCDFIGKVSPIHFFWGSFDLAVTRFSGRRAPLHPGAPGLPLAVTREAYSHEVSSAGFWPGAPGRVDALFYSYAYPEPPGYAEAAVRPAAAFYDKGMRELFLPYDAVRTAASPGDDLMAFLQTTYDAAASFGDWPREALERRRD